MNKKCIVAIFSALLCACATTKPVDYAPRFQAWAARDFSEKSQGPNPVGTVLISQPLPGGLTLFFEHKSSMATKHDKGELNSAGVGICVKLPNKRCD